MHHLSTVPVLLLTLTHREREKAARGRKDKDLKFVVLSEKFDKASLKYTTPAVPFPFKSQEVYEASIRQVCGCPPGVQMVAGRAVDPSSTNRVVLGLL
jgi:U3 small nucleolar RNA-associated protein 14